MDPYKVLQVDPEAEDEVIQAAYRRLAQKYHPDVAGPEGSARMASINAAWEILRDSKRRAVVDRERRAAAQPSAGSSPGAADQRPSTEPRGSTAPSGAGGSGSAAAGPATTAGRSNASSAGSGNPRPPEGISSDWSSGRNSAGSGYDPSRMRSPDGLGAAGPPPGDPKGSVLNFGRYAGWSLGEIARRDVDYVEWLDRMPIGRPYRDEIDVLLRQAGRRRSVSADQQDRRGLFRRR